MSLIAGYADHRFAIIATDTGVTWFHDVGRLSYTRDACKLVTPPGGVYVAAAGPHTVSQGILAEVEACSPATAAGMDALMFRALPQLRATSKDDGHFKALAIGRRRDGAGFWLRTYNTNGDPVDVGTGGRFWASFACGDGVGGDASSDVLARFKSVVVDAAPLSDPTEAVKRMAEVIEYASDLTPSITPEIVFAVLALDADGSCFGQRSNSPQPVESLQWC